jgi:cytidylate kinase
MLVTGIPRSGSTKYCYDLAEKLGYKFYDEIFEIGVPADHKAVGLHELKIDEIFPKTVEFIETIDFERSVINNHEINYFILEKTDIFISRRNVQDAVWSFIAHSHKVVTHYHPHFRPDEMETIMRQIQHRWIDRIIFFYDYVIAKNKQIVIPELTFSDSTKYRERFSNFTRMVNGIGERLRLPPGLEYK